jgi:hypothetical protein
MITALDSCPLNIRRSSASLIQIDGPGTGAPGAVLRSAKPNLSPEGLFSRKANCLTNNRVPRREARRIGIVSLLTACFRLHSVASCDFVSGTARWMDVYQAEPGGEPTLIPHNNRKFGIS